MKVVVDKLKADVARWFIPIIKEDGTIDTVIHEEAVWRFVVEKKSETGTMKDVLSYLDKEKFLKKRTRDIQVEVKLDKSAGFANDLMQDKEARLAVVIDEQGKPTHYVTQGDLRRVLLKECL